jgi:hypothetical protein
MANNKKKIVNVERLKPYYPPESFGVIDTDTSDRELDPFHNKFPALTHDKPTETALDDAKLDPPVTDEISPPTSPSVPPTRKRGRPRKLAPPAPSHFQNEGGMLAETASKKEKEREEPVREGICTRSQARARERAKQVQVDSLKTEKVEDLKNLIKQKIVLLAKCCFCGSKNTTHTRLCKVKGQNWLSGDVYKTQDGFPCIFSQDPAEQEEEAGGELNDSEEPEDAGYGGSSPPHPPTPEAEEIEELGLPPIPEEEDPSAQKVHWQVKLDKSRRHTSSQFADPSSASGDELSFHSAQSDSLEEQTLDYSALLQEASDAEDGIKKALEEAGTEEERQQLQQQSREISDFFARKILGLEQTYREFDFAQLSPSSSSGAGPSASTPQPKKSKSLMKQVDKLIFGDPSENQGSSRVTRSKGPVEDVPLPKTPAEYKKKK